MWPTPIDHTYILCDPAKEPERAAYLTKWLSDNAMPAQAYTMGLSCYGDTISDADVIREYNPWRRRRGSPWCGAFIRNLKKTEISLGMNWIAIAKASVEAGHKVVMMLESDVLFFPKFLTDLGTSLQQLKDREWDFLSISAGANLRPVRPADETDLQWFPPLDPYYHTRTTDAMIFRVSILKNILCTISPFSDIIDWELNYQLSLHNSKSLWLDPPIIRQGSGKEYPTCL